MYLKKTSKVIVNQKAWDITIFALGLSHNTRDRIANLRYGISIIRHYESLGNNAMYLKKKPDKSFMFAVTESE